VLSRHLRYDARRLSMRRKRVVTSGMRFRIGRFLKRQFTRWRGAVALRILF
jgi:hypothetical protein